MIFDAPPQEPKSQEPWRFVVPRAPLVDPRLAPLMVPLCAAIIVVLRTGVLADQVLRHGAGAIIKSANLALIGLHVSIALLAMILRSRPIGYVVALTFAVPVALVILLFVWVLVMNPFIALLGVEPRYLPVFMLGAPVQIILVLHAWAGARETPPGLRAGVAALFGTIAYLIIVSVAL